MVRQPKVLARLRSDLDAYWPTYLTHHLDRRNRALHDLGDICVLASVLTFNPALIGVGVVAGYSCAFAGHYLIEGRRPATLDHPVLAGLSNWRMFALGLRGELETELERHGLASMGETRLGVEALRERLLGRQAKVS